MLHRSRPRRRRRHLDSDLLISEQLLMNCILSFGSPSASARRGGRFPAFAVGNRLEDPIQRLIHRVILIIANWRLHRRLWSNDGQRRRRHRKLLARLPVELLFCFREIEAGSRTPDGDHGCYRLFLLIAQIALRNDRCSQAQVFGEHGVVGVGHLLTEQVFALDVNCIALIQLLLVRILRNGGIRVVVVPLLALMASLVELLSDVYLVTTSGKIPQLRQLLLLLGTLREPNLRLLVSLGHALLVGVLLKRCVPADQLAGGELATEVVGLRRLKSIGGLPLLRRHLLPLQL